MVSDIIVHTLMLVVFVVFLAFVVILWLWRCKSADDKQAYSDMLDTPEVNTYYTPSDYAKASKLKNKD